MTSRATHYAFLWSNNGQWIGGAQTLMACMANRLAARGSVVHAVFLGEEIPESVRALFDAGVRVSTIAPEESESWFFPLIARRRARPWMSADVAVALNAEALFYAWSAVRTGGPVVFPYLIGPDEYRPTQSKWPFREHPATLRVLTEIPPGQICFTSDELRRAHEAATGADVGDAQVLPVPVDTARFAAISRDPKRFEFVSVGRIDPNLKPYNTSFIDAVRQLRAEGFPITWRIYGADRAGGYSQSFANHLAEQRVDDFVDYRGEIDYARIPDVLTSAYAFIGMGTSAIEAAAAGVPTIIALAFESRPITQGLLHEQLGSNGERVSSLPELPVKDVMRGLMELQPPQYDALCRREADYAAATFEAGVRIDAFDRTVARVARSTANPRCGLPRAWFDTARDIVRFAGWKSANYWSPRAKRLLRPYRNP